MSQGKGQQWRTLTWRPKRRQIDRKTRMQPVHRLETYDDNRDGREGNAFGAGADGGSMCLNVLHPCSYISNPQARCYQKRTSCT